MPVNIYASLHIIFEKYLLAVFIQKAFQEIVGFKKVGINSTL